MSGENVDDAVRRCKTCEAEKPDSDFPAHNGGRRRNQCKDCTNARQRERYSQNRESHLESNRKSYRKNGHKWKRHKTKPETRKAWVEANKDRIQKSQKKSFLRRLYGIELEDFERLMEAQGGVCKICGKEDETLCVDHCHATGRVRGLLCKTCNSGIGWLNDDPELLKNAIAYLEETNEFL